MHCKAIKTVVQVSKRVWLDLERQVDLEVMLGLFWLALTHHGLSVILFPSLLLLASACHWSPTLCTP